MWISYGLGQTIAIEVCGHVGVLRTKPHNTIHYVLMYRKFLASRP